MTHPRLAVSEMCTYPWLLADELTIWDELGVHGVGLITAKVDEFGREAAVNALAERSLKGTTVIAKNFDLASPATWEETQNDLASAIDLAAEIGACVYITPGRRDGRSFDELTASLAAALAPCLPVAEGRGVQLAIEPSLRTDQSFVHTLRDGLEVAECAGIGVIADLGNCWMERDYEKTVRYAGSRIVAVQFADAFFGTPQHPSPGGRAVPGDGDLAIRGFIEAALESGYAGSFEIEQVGPRIEAEGHGSALRRAVEWATALLEEVLL